MVNRRALLKISTGATLVGGLGLKTFSPREALAANQNLFQNPFNHLGAHHRPIGSGALYGSSTHPMVTRLNRYRFSQMNSNNGSGCNVYANKATDPIKTVIARTWTRPTIGLPVTLKMPFMRNPETGDELESQDAVIVMLDITVSPQVFHEFFHWKWNSGSPSAHIHRSYPATGPGNCGPGRPRLGVSASGLPTIFGENRGFELNSETWGPIQHVMQLTVPHGPNGDCLAEKAVWPAGYTDSGTQTGPIPYGQLFGIPPSTPMPGSLSSRGRRVFAQMRDYGVRAIDGTQNSIKTRGAQDNSSSTRSDFMAFMPTLIPLLRPILNDAETQTASGGGTPRAPNTAFDT